MHQLQRTAFTIDRSLEFFTESELTTQIGYDRQLWPLVIAKELIDNALDACETGARAPELWVILEKHALTVADNGPGIPETVIEKSLDYHVRVSDKKNYISPTRGQLGNALKCVWAAPFVANGAHNGLVEVSAGGLTHKIEVTVDRLKGAPIIGHSTKAASVKNGTSVKVHWKEIASCEFNRWGFFYRSSTLAGALSELVADFAAFNPHATLHFNGRDFPASNPTWKKWRADQPTSAHWYQIKDLRDLIAAYIAERDQPVRDFLAEFAGLSGTQIRQKIMAEAEIAGGCRLSDMVANKDVDLEKVRRLLEAMQANSKPVNPERLGVIGEAHLEKVIKAMGAEDCRYWRQRTFDEKHLPLVIEIAFGVNRESEQQQRRAIGLNWSPVLKMPSGYIAEALNECRLEFGDEVTLLIHMAQPRFVFSDHGKGALAE